MMGDIQVSASLNHANSTSPDLIRYSHLLETLYASLWHSQGIESALHSFQDYFQCCSATLMALQISPRQLKYGWTIGVPEVYGKWYIENNMVCKDIAIDFFEQQSVTQQGFIAASQVLGNEIQLIDVVSDDFKPWLQVEKIVDTTGFVIPTQDNEHLILILQRNQHIGPFTPKELAELNLLTPHISQSVQLFIKFYRQQSENDSLQAAINTLTQPTIVLNNLLQVLHANDAVDKALAKNSAIHIVDKQITFSDEKLQNEFVFHACKLVSHRAFELMENINTTLTIPSNKGNFQITLSPMFSQNSKDKIQGLLVQIFEPERQAKLKASDIKEKFNVSLAQAEVCLLLAKGLSIKDIAEQRETSVNTVREQLRQIFKRTNFCRQTELVTAILRSTSH